MGDCLTRPDYKKAQKHKAKEFKQNDVYFVDRVVEYDPEALKSYDRSQFEELIAQLESEYKTFYSQIEKVARNKKPVPEITVEVQRGFDLFLPGCTNDLRPYVFIVLEPSGPSFSTEEASKYLPEWNKLFKINEDLENFEVLRVAVMFNEENGKPTELGSCNFLIKDLESQHVEKGWFKISKNIEVDSIPQVKLRIQLIYDEQSLYASLGSRAKNDMEKIKEDMIHSIRKRSIS